METLDIMTNDEVMEVAEVTSGGIGTGLKVAGGLAIVAGLIYGGYRFIRKRKASKTDGVVTLDHDEIEESDCDVENIG